MKTESGELLWCSDCGKIKINFESFNSNIDVMMKDIIWCSDLGHNFFSTISLNWWEVEIFLQIDERLFEFWKDDNVFDYTDIIDDQYVI